MLFDTEDDVADLKARWESSVDGDLTLDTTPDSNGEIEGAVNIIKNLIRRAKLSIEKQLNAKLPLSHPVVTWLVKHTAFCHNRFQVGEDGKTPYSRSRGKEYDKAMVQFGERVLYNITNNMIGPRLNQADTRAKRCFPVFQHD